MSLTNHNEILYRARLKKKIIFVYFKHKFLTSEKQQTSAQLRLYSAASSLDTPFLGLHIRFFNISSTLRPTHPCIPTHRCSRMLPHGEKHLPGPRPSLQLLNMARGPQSSCSRFPPPCPFRAARLLLPPVFLFTHCL